MKKITALFLLLAFCIPALGCANPRSPADTAATTMPWEDPSLSESDRKIREVSDPVVMKLYDITDLDDFEIDIYDRREDFKFNNMNLNSTDEPRYWIYYRFTLAGITTREWIRVEINSDFTFASMDSDEQGKYSTLLKNGSLKAIEEAKAKIGEKVKDYEESKYYYYEIDNDSYLWLKLEMIVNRPPEETNNGGCGDHDHLFFSEKICKAE